MGYIKNLGETIQRQVPLWAQSHVVPRGLLIPLDPWLNGTARAAKKVGDVLPVLVPNNTATLAKDLQPHDTTLTLADNTLTYLQPGFLISLNGIRIVGITGKSGNVLTLSQKAGVSLPSGTRVEVWGFPVHVLGEVLVPDPPLPRPDIFVFKSNVEVIQGDYLDIPIVDAQGNTSYNEYEIVEILAARKAEVEDKVSSLGVGSISAPTKLFSFPSSPYKFSNVDIGRSIVVHTATHPGNIDTYFITSIVSENQVRCATASVVDDPTISASLVFPVHTSEPLLWQVRIAQVTHKDVPGAAAQSLLTTADGIPRDLRNNETIYLRAFPAYVSKPLLVDSTYFNVPTAEIGPYVLDRVSGLVIDNPESAPPSEENLAGEGQVDVDEVCEISLLHSDLRVWEVDRLKVREQLSVWNPNIESEHIIMWSPIRGTMEFESGFIDLVLDKYGFAELETPLVPEIDLGAQNLPSFTLISQSDQPYNVEVAFYPNTKAISSGVQATSSGGTLWTSSMPIFLDPSGPRPRAIKITVSGDVGQKIRIHSVSSSLPRVTNIRYKILARTVGSYHWASSGLLQKPMFLSAYLTEGIGVQVPLDRGKIMYPGRKTVAPSAPSVSPCPVSISPTSGIGFRTRWNVREVEMNVTLPVGSLSSANYTVNWGDGSPVETNGTTHDYAVAGDYVVEIRGNCPSWSFMKFPGTSSRLTAVLSWGSPDTFFGFNDLEGGFTNCWNLTSLPQAAIPALGTGCPSFDYTFNGADLASIPPDLFSLHTEATSFASTFFFNIGITSVPSTLFRNNTKAQSFRGTFYYCFGLASPTAVPAELFSHCPLATDFSYVFGGCNNLTSIPSGLFDFNVNATTFAGAFAECSSLVSIPPHLFDFNALVTDFSGTFFQCLALTSIPSGLFDSNVVAEDFSSTFANCGSIAAIPPGLFDHNTEAVNFSYAFFNCVSLGSIPEDLFLFNSKVTGFEGTFGFSGITSIPAGLFRGNPLVTTFRGVFRSCIGFTEVPAGLFDYNTQVEDFSIAFGACDGILTIPAGLFDNCPLVRDFTSLFGGCWNLSAIPAGLFDYNTEVEKFGDYWALNAPYEYGGAFYGTSITTIPAGLFANNLKARDFSRVFSNCPNLTTVPDVLFPRTSPVWYGEPTEYVFYQNVFEECPNLQVNPNTFYMEGVGEPTRFVDQYVNLSFCFNRATFSGVQGKAPDLWACATGAGAILGVGAFRGGGNSLLSLSNYASIPGDWE